MSRNNLIHRGNLEPPIGVNRRLGDSIESVRCARRRRAEYFHKIMIKFSLFFLMFFFLQCVKDASRYFALSDIIHRRHFHSNDALRNDYVETLHVQVHRLRWYISAGSTSLAKPLIVTDAIRIPATSIDRNFPREYLHYRRILSDRHVCFIKIILLLIFSFLKF